MQLPYPRQYARLVHLELRPLFQEVREMAKSLACLISMQDESVKRIEKRDHRVDITNLRPSQVGPRGSGSHPVIETVWQALASDSVSRKTIVTVECSSQYQ